MSRKKIKQVDAIRQKTLETVIEEFLRHCRLKNLSPRTREYYEEDLSYFQRSVPVESVREVTREVMEDFIDHEMQKGNRITAINTRLRGLRVFFRFCQEREYMGDIGLKLLKEDETIKEPYDLLFAILQLLQDDDFMFKVHIANADVDQRVGANASGEEGVDRCPIPPFSPLVALRLLQKALKLRVSVCHEWSHPFTITWEML